MGWSWDPLQGTWSWWICSLSQAILRLLLLPLLHQIFVLLEVMKITDEDLAWSSKISSFMNVRCDYIYIYHGVYLRDVIINHMKSWSFEAKSKKEWADMGGASANTTQKILPNASTSWELDFGHCSEDMVVLLWGFLSLIICPCQRISGPTPLLAPKSTNRKSRASKMILLLDMALVPCSKGLYLHTGDPQPTTTPELGVLLSLWQFWNDAIDFLFVRSIKFHVIFLCCIGWTFQCSPFHLPELQLENSKKPLIEKWRKWSISSWRSSIVIAYLTLFDKGYSNSNSTSKGLHGCGGSTAKGRQLVPSGH